MASDPQIDGFDPDEVRDGLRLAMAVGLPAEVADQPVFVFPPTPVDTGDDTDGNGVPFDWRAGRAAAGAPTTFQVPCAIEYIDGQGKIENFGLMAPTRLLLTLLDEDYALIKGFSYVVIAGNQYFYAKTRPPLGLVSVGVWQVEVRTDDEG